jgi:hypothetical protein
MPLHRFALFLVQCLHSCIDFPLAVHQVILDGHNKIAALAVGLGNGEVLEFLNFYSFLRSMGYFGIPSAGS